jgi:ATP-binding cassette subfamily B protein/subfamily B ATP-binding cassette protein MsbA
MLGRWQATKTSVQIKPIMRRRAFEHALRLPLHRIYQIKTGGASSLLREDTASIGDLIFSMLYNPWKAIIQLIGSLIVLACVDWRLLVGSLLLLPMVFLTHRLWIRRIRPLYRDMHATRQAIDSHTAESFGGIRVVRSFGRQRTETGRFVRNDPFRARQEAHVWWWSRAVDILWAMLIPAASAALLWYGGTRVLEGVLTIGDLVLFLTYVMMLLEPVSVLAQSATGFQTSLAALDRVLDLVTEPVDMPSSSSAIVLDPAHVQGRITLRNVSFEYPGTTARVLEHLNLDVRPNQMIALVGASGAGKTTLCNLVARFYDPVEGSIEIDGIDLRKINVQSFRQLLGIVEQEIFLFDGTIAENIGYGRRHTDIDQVMHFARLAHAHEFISQFEHGYDTLIGERGVKLSGGQRQRLAIARALLADPRILILDEATSNLDTENEQLIQQSLRTLMTGRTSFVIAHRLSTIVHADLIVVLDAGRILETGTHDELMARSGRYRHMVEVQTEPVRAAARNGQQAPIPAHF